MCKLARSLKAYWGVWLAASTLVIGGAGHLLVSVAALPMDALKQQSLVLADSSGQWMHVRVTDGHYRLQPQAPVSANYVNLLLAYEDRRFREHGGIDLAAIARAGINNLTHGQVVSGASTISMQVSRLLRPHQRSFWGKLHQALGALWLERHYSKAQILQMYFTLAPFGGNVQGAEMASRWWFNKPPQSLSLAESALLVALPQRPAKHRPDRYPVLARKARDRVLRKGFESGLLTQQQYFDATHSPLPRQVQPFVQLNHHLADQAETQGLRGVQRVSIQLPLQRELVALAARWPLQAQQNLALVVLDPKGRLLAHVGSQDYFDAQRKGAVDFSRAIRSPGSTLKPLIYAQAETAGVLRYEEVYLDQVTDFGDYTPDNFDKADQGRQSFGDALTRSHNRAAVEALRRLGVLRFSAALANVGVELEGQLGLPAAVGGVGISLQHIAAAYTAFTHQGKSSSASWMQLQQSSPRTLISPSAAKRTSYLLRRAALPGNVARTRTLNNFALKTGTGPRGSDTLSLLYTQDYVVGVWIGSPDNQSIPDASGLSTAAPLALAAKDLLASSPAPQSLAVGPEINPPRLSDPAMRLAFPSDGAELAFPPGARAIRPRLNGGQYPVTVLLNGQHRQHLSGPSDLIRFPSAGFWSMGLQDAQARMAHAQVRVW